MDVTLPNGVVIRGVPDGTPKHVVSQKAISAGLATNKDFGYDDSEANAASDSGLENFTAGVGAGLTNVARRATNLVLPESITPEFASDEAIAEQATLDQDLVNTGAGMGGKVVGELAASLPLTSGVGGAVGRAAAATRPSSSVGKYLTKTLNRGAGRGAVEGATVGAILADPGERTGGALLAGAAGGVLGGAGTALGKTLGKGKVVEITKEAKQLEKLTGQFIPLSQSAESGLTKQIYNAFLANIPGVGGKIRGQYTQALDDVRRFVGEHALPDTAKALNITRLTGRESIEGMKNKLQLYWDDAFEEIKKWPIKAFKKDTPVAPKFLADLVEKQGKGMVKILKPGQTISGDDLLKLKNTIGEIIPTLGKQPKGVAIGYSKKLDELIKRNLDPTGKGKGKAAQVYSEYLDAQKYWPAWNAFKKALDKAKNLEDFNMPQIARAAKEGKGKVFPKDTHESPLATQRRVGQLGVEALEDFPSRQGLFQSLAATAPALGVAGAIAGGATLGTSLVAAPVIIALGRMGASKGLQKFLSGQTKFQRLNKVLMRKYKDELQKLGATARQASIIVGEKDAT